MARTVQCVVLNREAEALSGPLILARWASAFTTLFLRTGGNNGFSG
jgi:hypothetical protein